MKRLRCALVLCLAAEAIFACSSDYRIWIPRSPSADPLYRFINGDKAGYIDQRGKIVIPATLPHWGGNSGGEFHNGLLELAVSNGVYIDATGKRVIDKGLYRGWDFSVGLAVAMRKGENKWGYIDKTGEFVIRPQFDTFPNGYVWPFEDGFAKIEVAGRLGYIDHSGKFAIPPQLLDAESFANGMARVIVEGPCVYVKTESACPNLSVVPKGTKEDSKLPACKHTFIDKSGRVITSQRYEDARNFAEGLAPVRVGGFWGYIDEEGKMSILPRFDTAESFADGLAVVSERGMYGFIDHTGSYAIRPQWKSADEFVEGRAVVGDGNMFWYIDHDGRQAIPGKFEAASPFFKGLAHVAISGQHSFAYIDRTGKRVFVYKP
jgi:hypothetical protein